MARLFSGWLFRNGSGLTPRRGAGPMADVVTESQMVTTIGPGGERRRADPACPWYEEVTGPGPNGGRWRRYGDCWSEWRAYDPAPKGYPAGQEGAWYGPVDAPVFPRLPQQLSLGLTDG